MNSQSTPKGVAQMRFDQCRRCETRCGEFEAGKIDVFDAASSCPLRKWAAWGEAAGFARPNAQLPAPAAAKKPAPRLKPGSALAWLIERLTAKPASSCAACAARVKKMNAWGWRGCWARRREILGWLAAEARKIGYKEAKPAFWSLARIAVKSGWRRGDARLLHNRGKTA